MDVIGANIKISVPDGTEEMVKERIAKDMERHLNAALKALAHRLNERVPNINVETEVEIL